MWFVPYGVRVIETYSNSKNQNRYGESKGQRSSKPCSVLSNIVFILVVLSLLYVSFRYTGSLLSSSQSRLQLLIKRRTEKCFVHWTRQLESHSRPSRHRRFTDDPLLLYSLMLSGSWVILTSASMLELLSPTLLFLSTSWCCEWYQLRPQCQNYWSYPFALPWCA